MFDIRRTIGLTAVAISTAAICMISLKLIFLIAGVLLMNIGIESTSQWVQMGVHSATLSAPLEKNMRDIAANVSGIFIFVLFVKIIERNLAKR